MSTISTFRSLVGKTPTKSVQFLGTNIDIRKLSVAQVEDIQQRVKALPKADMENPGDGEAGAHLNLMIHVIRLAVVGADDVTDDEFRTFPLEDLQKLSDEILRHSGLGKDSASAKR